MEISTGKAASLFKFRFWIFKHCRRYQRHYQAQNQPTNQRDGYQSWALHKHSRPVHSLVNLRVAHLSLRLQVRPTFLQNARWHLRVDKRNVDI